MAQMDQGTRLHREAISPTGLQAVKEPPITEEIMQDSKFCEFVNQQLMEAVDAITVIQGFDVYPCTCKDS